MSRRCLPWVLALGAALHLAGMARAIVPAQDGLKFLRVARRFQSEPWADVVRGSDQHPLYPACVALAQPLVAAALGDGPDAWRIAAQGVSAIAALALVVPLFGLTRVLFGTTAAALAALLLVVLPAPAEVGHETLSDATALALFATTLWLGEVALRTRGLTAALGCGLAAGLGYWTRPEVAVAPLAVLVAGAVGALRGLKVRAERAGDARLFASIADGIDPRTPSPRRGEGRGEGRPRTVRGPRPLSLTLPPGGGGDQTPAPGVQGGPGGFRLAAVAVSFLFLVGTYGLIKGELSEKLAIRRGATIGSRHDAPRKVAQPLPKGLDDPRWDFSAKEESGHPGRLALGAAAGRLATGWAEGLGWIFAPLALWGAGCVRARSGRLLIAAYVLLFTALLLRHATLLGYLSGRHALTLVIASLPFAAAGALDVARRVRQRCGWDEATARRRGAMVLVALVLAGVASQQARPGHPSRWGHREAGRWLAAHAEADAAVLDTRGWAAFVSGRPSYDYWHVRQALSDARLAYVVVGADELSAPSRRAATLRALLAYAAEPAASFPGRRGGSGADVRVFRFHRPASWEGLRP